MDVYTKTHTHTHIYIRMYVYSRNGSACGMVVIVIANGLFGFPLTLIPLGKVRIYHFSQLWFNNRADW